MTGQTFNQCAGGAMRGSQASSATPEIEDNDSRLVPNQCPWLGCVLASSVEIAAVGDAGGSTTALWVASGAEVAAGVPTSVVEITVVGEEAGSSPQAARENTIIVANRKPHQLTLDFLAVGKLNGASPCY